jgi:hypothetical protein
MEFNDKVVDQIVEKVVAKLAEQHIEGHQAENPSENQPGQDDGVFQDMGICINAAVSAQKMLLKAPVEDRRRFIQVIREKPDWEKQTTMWPRSAPHVMYREWRI